jgi:hypothetical protein
MKKAHRQQFTSALTILAFWTVIAFWILVISC